MNSHAFFRIFAFMSKEADPIIDYIYEYMVKTMLPVVTAPSTFNSIAVRTSSTNKTIEYIMPYDREGLYKIVCMLIQNYSTAAPMIEIIDEKFEHKNCLTLRKYNFECDNYFLVELYDFLGYVKDDFVTTLKVKSVNMGGYIGFIIYLDKFSLVNIGLLTLSIGDRELAIKVMRQIKVQWMVLQEERKYWSIFTKALDSAVEIPLYFSWYSKPIIY